MTLTPELEEAFNAQITMEYAAAYSYLGMSAWLETQGLPGMASWMRMQSDEETTHGLGCSSSSSTVAGKSNSVRSTPHRSTLRHRSMCSVPPSPKRGR